jgi:hypothetical protein
MQLKWKCFHRCLLNASFHLPCRRSSIDAMNLDAAHDLFVEKRHKSTFPCGKLLLAQFLLNDHPGVVKVVESEFPAFSSTDFVNKLV